MSDCFCRYSAIIAILKCEPKEFSQRVAFQLKKTKKNKKAKKQKKQEQEQQVAQRSRFFFYYLLGSGGTSGSSAVSNDFENLPSINHNWVT